MEDKDFIIEFVKRIPRISSSMKVGINIHLVNIVERKQSMLVTEMFTDEFLEEVLGKASVTADVYKYVRDNQEVF